MNQHNAGLTGKDPVSQARALGPAIAAAADELERTQTIPESLLNRIHDARLPRMLLPRSVDGDEVAPWTYLFAIEEISRHDASTGWNMFVANSSALIAPFLSLETAREVFASPRAWVSWGPPNEHVAQAVPGGYRLTGQWDFASGSRQADWMGAHCQVRETDGSMRLNRHGKPEIKTFLFRKDRTTQVQNWHTIGLLGTASEGYRVRDLFVPEAFATTREDPAARRDRGPLFAFTMSGLYAVGVVGVGLGIARAMLDEFTALAREKVPRGLPRLADSALVQAGLARQEATWGSARSWMVDILKDVYDRAGDIEPIGVDDRVQVRLGCTHALAAVINVADWVYKAAGTSAIFRGSPFERRYRDMHTLSQQIQARDAHFESVGRVLLNGDPSGTFL